MTSEIHAMVDYITDPAHKWDPSKYLTRRQVSGVTEKGVEFSFTYSYQLGTAYLTGVFGSEGQTIDMQYIDGHGFQIYIGGYSTERDPVCHPYHRVQLIKDFFDRWVDR